MNTFPGEWAWLMPAGACMSFAKLICLKLCSLVQSSEADKLRSSISLLPFSYLCMTAEPRPDRRVQMPNISHHSLDHHPEACKLEAMMSWSWILTQILMHAQPVT